MKITNYAEVISWLRETDNRRLERLWRAANEARKNNVGDAVQVRGLLEVSNYCVRKCNYCGINVTNRSCERYRIDPLEVFELAKQAASLGYKTIVLQAGEDPALTGEWISCVIKKIKKEIPSLAITLSLGERSFSEIKQWRQVGADRYLLRFETSDLDLYQRVHPAKQLAADKKITAHPRIELLKELRRLGYEIGSGVMIGFLGQTYEILAQDLLTFHQLDLDMIGVGPYLVHPLTELALKEKERDLLADQVPNTALMVYKALALSRILCPTANLPVTTALRVLDQKNSYLNGLNRGANVVMLNLTPIRFYKQYEIYPGKAHQKTSMTEGLVNFEQVLVKLGRALGQDIGSRKKP